LTVVGPSFCSTVVRRWTFRFVHRPTPGGHLFIVPLKPIRSCIRSAKPDPCAPKWSIDQQKDRTVVQHEPARSEAGWLSNRLLWIPDWCFEDDWNFLKNEDSKWMEGRRERHHNRTDEKVWKVTEWSFWGAIGILGSCPIHREANHRTNRGSVSWNAAEGGQRSGDAKVTMTSKSSAFMRNPTDHRVCFPFYIASWFAGLLSIANLISHRVWNNSKSFPISRKSNFHTFPCGRSAELLPSFEAFNDFCHFEVSIFDMSAMRRGDDRFPFDFLKKPNRWLCRALSRYGWWLEGIFQVLSLFLFVFVEMHEV
jgi:hypothetical protein